MALAQDRGSLAWDTDRARRTSVAVRRGISSVCLTVLAGFGLAAVSVVVLLGLLLYGSVLEF